MKYWISHVKSDTFLNKPNSSFFARIIYWLICFDPRKYYGGGGDLWSMDHPLGQKVGTHFLNQASQDYCDKCAILKHLLYFPEKI